MTKSLLQNPIVSQANKEEIYATNIENKDYNHQIAVNNQNLPDKPLQLQSNSYTNIQDLKVNIAQSLAVLDDSNKENQSPKQNLTQNSENNPSYYLGDDDEEITDSEEEEEIDSSDEQQQQQPEEESSSSEQIEQSEQQIEQSDEDLQDDDNSSSQVGSDDQQQSEDEYPDDYDSDQVSQFDKLVKQACDEPSTEQTQQQFLERYQKIKLALQIEQLHLKQEQTIYTSFPAPLELQLKKMRLNQGILHFINKNYVRRLNLDQARRKRKFIQERQSITSEAELNCDDQQQTESIKEVEHEKASKRVVFLNSIQAKMYKNDEEVHLIKQAAQFQEALNSCEKGSKRIVTISLNNSTSKQNIPNRPRLASCYDINTSCYSNLQSSSKQSSTKLNPTLENTLLGSYTVREQDLKSNDTNSSQQLRYKQQFQFQSTPKTKVTPLSDSTFKASQVNQSKQHVQHNNNVYFCSDCIHSQTLENGLIK